MKIVAVGVQYCIKAAHKMYLEYILILEADRISPSETCNNPKVCMFYRCNKQIISCQMACLEEFIVNMLAVERNCVDQSRKRGKRQFPPFSPTECNDTQLNKSDHHLISCHGLIPCITKPPRLTCMPIFTRCTEPVSCILTYF